MPKRRMRVLAKTVRRTADVDNGLNDLDEEIDVKRILGTISDGRKRLAFHLFMNGASCRKPYESMSNPLRKALNISERTAREWVKEVRLVLVKERWGETPHEIESGREIMNDVTRMTDRDEVLFAFHQAYATDRQRKISSSGCVAIRNSPDDIRAHAAVAWDWATQAQEAEQPLDETMSARAYSQALNIIYSSEPASAPNESLHTNRTFQQMQAADRKRDICTRTGNRCRPVGASWSISRPTAGCLPPIRGRACCCACASVLAPPRPKNSILHLDSALQAPRLGHAKSSQTPSVVSRPCDDIIRESSMSDDRKSYWLGEDAKDGALDRHSPKGSRLS